ncbi:MAG TPA: adenylate/guanylate cyclase domain-containing protein [Labilithrix sp.]|nr:adenylate/guanylate cyclase domain-containing protein [Labilithrix sp.]
MDRSRGSHEGATVVSALDADDGRRSSSPPAVQLVPTTPPDDMPVDTTSRRTPLPEWPTRSEPARPSIEPARITARPSPPAVIEGANEPRARFEVALGREILGAERFRAGLLLAIPTVALFALVIVRGAYPEAVVSLLHGHFELAPVGLFLMAVAAFEFLVLASIRRQLKRDARPSAARRYTQALVEASLPTAVVLYYAAVDGPVQALLMPSTFVYFVFILLSTLRLDFALCAFTGLVAAGEYAAIAVFWSRNETHVEAPALASFAHHLGKAAILLVSGVAAGFVAQRLRRSFTRALESVEERQRILGVFGQHVSPQVVEKLVLGKTEVRSELREVCVMFLDIRDFTSFAESKSPAEVVDYLNAVFESTIDVVAEHHGIINKFLGDGFMAIFGAPIAEEESCTEAVSAALDIVARIDQLVADGKLPPTRVGIGLHAGKAVVGNIGSAQRKEYTVIGDVVNVASRIEALNKQLGSSVLASEEVWKACRRSDVNAVARESIAIRGRAQPVRIWQLA